MRQGSDEAEGSGREGVEHLKTVLVSRTDQPECFLCHVTEDLSPVHLPLGLVMHVCEACKSTAQIGVAATLYAKEFLTRVLKK